MEITRDVSLGVSHTICATFCSCGVVCVCVVCVLVLLVLSGAIISTEGAYAYRQIHYDWKAPFISENLIAKLDLFTLSVLL